jgi:hypothetical protein
MRPLLTLTLTLFSCALAQASTLSPPVLGATAQVLIGQGQNTLTYTNPTIYTPYSASDGVSVSAPVPNVDGSAQTGAYLTDNGIFMNGNASVFSPYSPANEDITAIALASITDTFDLTSGISASAPGQFQFIYQLNGFVSATAGGSNAIAEFAAWVGTAVDPPLFPNASEDCNSGSCFGTNGLNNSTFCDPPGCSAQLNQLVVTLDAPAVLGEAIPVSFQLYESVDCDPLTAELPFECSASTNFPDTAQLVGFNVLDANGNIVPDAVVQTGSGVDYFAAAAAGAAGNAAPEPSTISMSVLGAALVFVGRRRLRNHRMNNYSRPC